MRPCRPLTENTACSVPATEPPFAQVALIDQLLRPVRDGQGHGQSQGKLVCGVQSPVEKSPHQMEEEIAPTGDGIRQLRPELPAPDARVSLCRLLEVPACGEFRQGDFQRTAQAERHNVIVRHRTGGVLCLVCP